MGRLEIGKQIAWLRKQKGIMQDQLAGILGASTGDGQQMGNRDFT